MRKLALLLGVLFLVHGAAARLAPLAGAGSSGPDEARALEATFARALERIGPSILKVHPPGERSPDLARKTRTAIAIEPDLAIMDATSIAATGVDEVVLEDSKGVIHKARWRGRDSRLRVIALEVEGGGLTPAPRAGRIPEPGTFVLCAGFVYGARPHATFGIVSACGRFEGRAIQVDCAIDPSNAGGALVDFDGELVGIPVIVDRKLGDDSGVGFVVPTARVVPVIGRLRNGDDIQPGVMGVMLPREEPDVSPALDGGVRVEGVLDGGPARAAGMQTNDVIVKLDGQRVRSLRGLLARLSLFAAGDDLPLVVLREGTEIPITVKLAPR